MMRIAARIRQIEQALFGAKRMSAEENLNQLRQ
jgi:hypothetical protein